MKIKVTRKIRRINYRINGQRGNVRNLSKVKTNATTTNNIM